MEEDSTDKIEPKKEEFSEYNSDIGIPVVVASDNVYQLLRYRRGEMQIEKCWKVFNDRKIEAIIVKGWAAARNYPEPRTRMLGDIDLAVNPQSWEKAREIKLSFNLSEVDLHCGLKKLDSAEWDRTFENAEFVRCGDTDIRIPCAEDHLRILCVHWLNDGGIYKNKLWDIYYAVKNRPSDFDWDKCLGVVSVTRRKWIICVIGITHKYLGLEIKDLPFSSEAEKIPSWMEAFLEKEWRNEIKFKYLDTSIYDRKEFFSQLKKRFPPNPIQATIYFEGEFDDSSRITYQLKYFLHRLLPTARRLTANLSEISGKNKNA